MNRFKELADKYIPIIWGGLLTGIFSLAAIYCFLFLGKAILRLLGVI